MGTDESKQAAEDAERDLQEGKSQSYAVGGFNFSG